jgi:hypothetical protein
MRDRIFLVKGEQVAIIKSNPHTYNVRFVKSGKFMEVYKHFVISWYPDKSKRKPLPATKPKTNNQSSLDL